MELAKMFSYRAIGKFGRDLPKERRAPARAPALRDEDKFAQSWSSALLA